MLVLSFIIFLISNICLSYYVKAPVTSQVFSAYFFQGSNLAFQDDRNTYLNLYMVSGDLNSSNCLLTMSTSRGNRFSFVSNETFTLRLTFNVSQVQVEGDQGNDLRTVATGQNFNILATNYVSIYWRTRTTPLLPIVFILGMVGLVACFAGPLYAVKEIKKKNYREGFITGTILLAIGIGLVFTWLW